MSGRDLRKFLNFHRDAIGSSDNSLVTRVTEGHRSSRYKPIDYAKLQAFTQIKRAAGNRTLQKIEQITQARKQTKEQNLLQQHKACWSKEQIKLASLQKKYQNELDGIRPGSPYSYHSIVEFFRELEIYEDLLSEEMKDFKKKTVDPVWDLREDLQFWLGENRERLILGEADRDHAEVMDVVNSVKIQQQQVMGKLEHEQRQLEAELESSPFQLLVAPGPSSEVRVIKTGIPEEALNLECPDVDFRESVLQEFLLLDKKYESYLEYLALKYSGADSSDIGGWTKEDHFHFMCILEQYPPELPNRRMLYIDRMLREIPHKTRAELVQHEKWWMAHKFYHEQRLSSLRAWSNDREDLLLKAKVTFLEALAAHEEAVNKEITRQRQQQICQELYEKVLAFREQKLEALRLQSAIAARKEEEEREMVKALREREAKRREQIHEKIQKYEDQKARQRREEAEREAIRLAEIQAQLEEQAKLDRERVKFREEKQKEKEEARQRAHEAALEAEREKEQRLDSLREMVQVHVENDPERVFKQTEATLARLASAYDEETELQKPLFTVYGYEDRKVSSDPRLKVEQALRNAGLHSTDYARRILATVKPPQQPRKDQQSTLFKDN
ncbi:coiled-coil domain-containing protein 148 [Nematostella vectensis]|uniref:coiled-coil domain-containing protein 148 n=1 Tax=Nematostella vectensis TaxID=45351 RepID=UPI0020775DFD|nr:coiled-coil domain-containing protein 148 [Nematostella vectensis]